MSDPAPRPNPAEATSLRDLGPYPKRLFLLLTLATFFEGFDTALAQLVLPLLGDEFGATRSELGDALAVAGIGMMAAFLLIRAADRIGRRPVMLVSIGGFALLTLASAAAPSLTWFAALQFGARLFLVSELAMAYVMLGEELPPAVRGRANGLLGGFASVGAAVPALLLASLVEIGWGWRGLFALGTIPLLLWPVYWRVLREPATFTERKRERPPPPIADELREWGRVLAPGVRRRFVGASAIWWTVNFWSGTAFYFFTAYAFSERGWTPADLTMLPIGMIPAGIVGYAASGFAMDRFGRRPTATAFLALGTAVTLATYHATSDLGIMLGYFAMVGLGGLWTIAATFSTELFPTELRATATGLANNIVGRTGIVVGPLVAGRLSDALGSTSEAISWLAVVNLLCIPVVWRLLPETRGVALDRVGTDAPADPGERA